MHNIMSYNQMAAWRHLEENTLDADEQDDLINDYFDCLIECDDNQQSCRRVCSEILRL